MTRQFPADPDVAFPSLQTVDGADIVQAATGHVVARGRVRTRHHPGGAQGNGVDLGEKVDASDILYLCVQRKPTLKIECEPTTNCLKTRLQRETGTCFRPQ